MDKNRRNILNALFAASVAGSSLLFSSKSKAGQIFTHWDESLPNLDTLSPISSLRTEGGEVFPNPPVLPKSLKKGSKIALIAPASHASPWELNNVMRAMASLGITVEIGNTIKNYNVRTKYFSASDDVRAKEVMDYIKRDDIDAIMAVRGGYGVMRILDMLDFKEICAHPKIIIGFSDITALLNATYRLCNIVTFHGPVGVSSFNWLTLKSFKDMLYREPLAKNKEYKPIVYKDELRTKTLNKGIARGRLIGGNLTMLSGTLGSPFEIDTTGAILFIEEVSEDPYKIDRMLTQLWLNGKLQKCSGIMFGWYPDLDKKYYFFPNISFTAREVIESRIKKLNIPSVIGIPIGHIEDNWTLPIGIMAELNADKRELKILEPAVS